MKIRQTIQPICQRELDREGRSRFEQTLRKMDENKPILIRGSSQSLRECPQPEKGAYYRGILGLKQGGRRRDGVNLDPELISLSMNHVTWTVLILSSLASLTHD